MSHCRTLLSYLIIKPRFLYAGFLLVHVQQVLPPSEHNVSYNGEGRSRANATLIEPREQPWRKVCASHPARAKVVVVKGQEMTVVRSSRPLACMTPGSVQSFA